MVVVAVVAALLISLAWGGLALEWGPRLGYLDQPDDSRLKAHALPAVPLGGVGLFSAFHVGAVVAGVFDPFLFAATGMLLFLGLVDDRFSLAPSVRLVVETAAATVCGIGLGGDWLTSLAITLLVVVAVNAVNLFDGLDGLAAGTGLVTALGIAALAAARGQGAAAGLVLAAALLGFVRWNWPPARLFLGDNGAYVLGGLLAGLIAEASSDLPGLAVGACLLGVYLADLGVTVLRRLAHRQALFSGDRNHLYDLLHAGGFPVRGVVAVAVTVQTVLAVGIVLAG